MIPTPNTREELLSLEKQNNVVVKINSTSKLSGMFPAYRKVARWNGSNDAWDVFFVAAKDYSSLNDEKLKSEINYDKMMGKLNATYSDYAKREVAIFFQEQQAVNYLIS